MIQNEHINPEIIHEPLGTENPYHVSPIERDPREPITGQAVKLNALSVPKGVFSQVNVELWRAGDQERLIVKAQLVPSDENGDHWQAELPELEAGQEYSYRFEGSPSPAPFYSVTFIFEVYEKVAIQKVLGIKRAKSALIIFYQTNKESLFLQLKLSAKDNQELRGHWAILDELSADGLSNSRPITETTSLKDFKITIDGEKCLLSIKNSLTGLSLRESSPCEMICDRNQDVVRMRQSFQSADGEAFYGFGERYNALNQRGNILDNIAYDQWGPQGKRTYFPVPFFLSSNNYGFFIDTNRNIVFDVCASRENEWSFEAEMGKDRTLTLQLWTSQDPKQIITQFTDQVGKPKLPPDWVFGLWMSSNCWDNQARAVEEVEKSIQYNIPISVVVLEAWTDETTIFLWNDSEYSPQTSEKPFSYSDFTFRDSGKWTDPKKLVEYLDSLGIRLVLWQVPVIKSLHENKHDYGPQPQHQRNQNYVMKNKYCLMTKSGKPYQIPNDQWFANSMMVDFTNPQAVEWWMENRRYLIEEIGVAGFKTDGGEQATLSRLLASNGMEGDEIRNLYPKQYLKTYSKFLESTRGEDWVLFSRSGYTGAQSYSCHWAGDQPSTWDTIKEILFAGLSAGLAGVSFWGWDIGGFSNTTPTDELYLRSTALAAFCPIMQFHSIVTDEISEEDRTAASFDRTPWNIQKVSGNPEVIPIFRKFVNVRMSLIPYLLNEARESAATGIPMMRSVAVFAPDEELAKNYPFQYYLGSDLLIAPVVEQGKKEWEIYLPKGRWVDFWTRAILSGGRAINHPAHLDKIPVFVRQGAILPLNLPDSLTLGDPLGIPNQEHKHLCFQIFPRESGSLDCQYQGQSYHVSYNTYTEKQEIRIQTGELDNPVFLLVPGTRPDKITWGAKYDLSEINREELFTTEGDCWTIDRDLIVVKITSKKKDGEIIIKGFQSPQE